MSSEIPKTQKVILIRENGGPEVLRYEEDFPVPSIADNEILIKNKYAGINFIESYFRSGLYPSEKPYVLGREASGVVVAVGDKVTKYKVGELVAYLSSGTFLQYTKQSADTGKIIKLPADASEDYLKKVAGALINGLTTLTFVTDSYNVKEGDYILVQAVAGGCGLLFTQWIKQRGAYVIGTASTDEKLELAKQFGADYLINSKTQNVEEEVKKITKGKGVAAVYDGIGKDTFDQSLAVLGNKGTLVTYGNASGAVPPLSVLKLTSKNVKLLRPSLFNYISADEDWEFYSKELIAGIEKGLKIHVTETFPLKEYRTATEKLESRQTTGKLVLSIPQ